MFATLRSTIVEHGSTFDAGAFSAAEAVEVLVDLEVIARVVDSMRSRAIKRIADTNGHVGTSARDAATFVAKKLDVPVGYVREKLEIADQLEHLESVAAAVRDGRVSLPVGRLIADAASIDPSAQQRLLAAAGDGLGAVKKECRAVKDAAETPKERAARQKKLQSWRTWTDSDGMLAGRFRFRPEDGGPIVTLIEGLRQKLFREHRAGKDHESQDYYAAQAAVSLLIGNANAGVQFRVHVLIDHEALKRGHALEGETCEIQGVGTVSVEWVRSILGQAFLTAVIKNGVDVTTVAHLGRHVKAEVMTALIVGGHECDIDGCEIHGYLERDHLHEIHEGGLTSLANLHWLCYYHHQLKTRGWILGPPHPITGKRKLSPPQSKNQAA